MTAPAAVLFYGCLAIGSATRADTPPSVGGAVLEARGGPLAAVLITARPMSSARSITVMSDSAGR